jgi:hypothetical protein
MHNNEIICCANKVQPFKAIQFHQRGKRKTAITEQEIIDKEINDKKRINKQLINAVAKAFYWNRLIETGVISSGTAIAAREGLNPSTVNEQLKIALLSPLLIESIINGTEPKKLTMQWLTRNSLPTSWLEQRAKMR